MKYRYIGLLSISLPICSIAQFTINQAGNAPTLGSEFEFHRQQVLTDPGAAGNGQTWDFSMLSSTSNGTIYVEDPMGVAGTHMIRNDSDTLYYTISGEGMFLVKEESMMTAPGFGSEPVTVDYTGEGVKLLEFPASLNTAWNGTVFGNYVLQGGAFTRSGTVNGVVDAEGSLLLNSNTYDNVLRIHSFVSTNENGVISSVDVVGTRHLHNWSYYTEWLKHPLVKITADTISVSQPLPASSPTVRTEWLDDLSIGVIESIEQGEAFGLWPTPARDVLNITLPQRRSEKVQGILRDLTGRTVREWSLASFGNSTVDISGLPAGQYLLQVLNGANEIGVRKVIVH
ncbi:MAG: T9SS type A sorting domain-containing protein [Bacteroidota bacterium]|nr:T9SS type A sorting domain-containing protein [Bacteroidota bacterium]